MPIIWNTRANKNRGSGFPHPSRSKVLSTRCDTFGSRTPALLPILREGKVKKKWRTVQHNIQRIFPLLVKRNNIRTISNIIYE